MAFLRYHDRPGVVGVVGRVLGEAGVNIGGMQVSRDAGGNALIVLTVEHFTVGHVLEEQNGIPAAGSADDFDLDAFARDHPTVLAGITEYFQDGRTPDDLFRDCLDVIMEGAGRNLGGGRRV